MTPIVSKLRRKCKDCEKMFVPNGKFQRYCERCMEKRLGKGRYLAKINRIKWFREKRNI